MNAREESTHYRYRKTSGVIAVLLMVLLAVSAIMCGLVLGVSFRELDLETRVFTSVFLAISLVMVVVMYVMARRMTQVYTINADGIRWSRSQGAVSLPWNEISRVKVIFTEYGLRLFDRQGIKRITVHNDLQHYRSFLQQLLDRVPEAALGTPPKKNFVSSLWLPALTGLIVLSIVYQRIRGHASIPSSEYWLAGFCCLGSVITFQHVALSGGSVRIRTVQGVQRIPLESIESMSVTWSPGFLLSINGATGLKVMWDKGKKAWVNLTIANLARLYVQIRKDQTKA